VLRALLLVAVLATASVAPAAESTDDGPGWQFGVALGQSDLHIKSDDLDASGSIDDFGGKLFGGYRFNPYSALEVGYIFGGNMEESEGGVSASIKPRLLTAALRLTAPFTDAFDLGGFVKAGIARWDADLELSDGFDSASLDGSGTDLLWGLGLKWTVRNVDLRLEYERVEIGEQDIIDDISADFDYNLFSVGAVWTF
jgi:OmpA-OmpF porin, OOP family